MTLPPATPEWRAIPGYEGSYEISDAGEIRSLKPKFYGRVLKPSSNGHGYLHVSLSLHNRVITRSLHTLVMLAFVGPCPEGLEVRHLNGVRWDNRRSNLEYGTHSENEADKTLHGTRAKTARQRVAPGGACSIDGCEKERGRYRRLCYMHEQRKRVAIRRQRAAA